MNHTLQQIKELLSHLRITLKLFHWRDAEQFNLNQNYWSLPPGSASPQYNLANGIFLPYFMSTCSSLTFHPNQNNIYIFYPAGSGRF